MLLCISKQTIKIPTTKLISLKVVYRLLGCFPFSLDLFFTQYSEHSAVKHYSCFFFFLLNEATKIAAFRWTSLFFFLVDN